MKTVGDILKQREKQLSSHIFYVETGQTVLAVCQFMKASNVGAVCVIDGTKFAGILSERDVVRRVIAEGRDPAKLKIEQVMTTDLLVAPPDEPYMQCLERMRRAKVRHLPVVEGESKLLGMLSMRDLLDEEMRACQFERQALTDYVYQTPPAVEP